MVFLQGAEYDLKEIKKYILENFSEETWLSCYDKIKQSIHVVQLFPESGSLPVELEALHLMQYRQVVSGQNRIIYQIEKLMIYIHLICDTRKNLSGLLMRRLTRQI